MTAMNYTKRIPGTRRVRWSDRCRSRIPEGEHGKWRVERFTVTGKEWQGFSHRHVPAGTYTRLVRGRSTTVMSDTPDEIRDAMWFLGEAKGRVLIHGLGLGATLQGVLSKGSVRSVDVVEIDEELIELIGPHFARDPRLTIHHGDALTYRFPSGMTWDVAWHDIWDTICADNLPDMRRLHRRYGRRVNWQQSWCRDQCERW